MSMGVLPARPQPVLATQARKVTAQPALLARGAVRVLRRHPSAVMYNTSAQLDKRHEAGVTLESILPARLQNQHLVLLVMAAQLVTTARATVAAKNANQVIIP